MNTNDGHSFNEYYRCKYCNCTEDYYTHFKQVCKNSGTLYESDEKIQNHGRERSKCLKCGIKKAKRDCRWYEIDESVNYRTRIITYHGMGSTVQYPTKYYISRRYTSSFCKNCSNKYLSFRFFLGVLLPLISTTYFLLLFIGIGIPINLFLFYLLCSLFFVSRITQLHLIRSLDLDKIHLVVLMFVFFANLTSCGIMFESLFDRKYLEIFLNNGPVFILFALFLDLNVLISFVRNIESVLGDYAIWLNRSKLKHSLIWNQIHSQHNVKNIY